MIHWTVFSKETDQVIGTFILMSVFTNRHLQSVALNWNQTTIQNPLIFTWATVGYSLSQRVWNKGYASEILSAAIQFAVANLNIKQFFADTILVNQGSQKVLEKNGFKKIFSDYARSYFVFEPQ